MRLPIAAGNVTYRETSPFVMPGFTPGISNDEPRCDPAVLLLRYYTVKQLMLKKGALKSAELKIMLTQDDIQ